MPSDEREEFFSAIENGLAAFPLLAELAPEGYPRKGKSAVKYEKAVEFESVRNERYLHNVNLNLFLGLAGNPNSIANAKAYSLSLLRVFERFVGEFQDTPRMRTVLEPLWRDPWSSEPVLWSVLAHCHM